MKISSLEIIRSTVSQVVGLNIESKSKTNEYVRGRLIYFKIASQLTTLSQSVIAKEVNKDHASFIHNIKNFDRDILNNDNYRLQYEKSFRICNDIIKNEKIDIKGIDKIDAMIVENINLKNKISLLMSEIDNIKLSDDPTENELLTIFRKLNFTDKIDLIFKAKTILKVKQRLNETANVRRV